MRIIAGSRKTLRLKTVEGMGTRPTTDRIKETLFNMIQPIIPGSRFLDIFAGSGGIGLEALSRGAVFCTFIEKDRRAISCIRENIRHTGFEAQSHVYPGDAAYIIKSFSPEEPYDIIFMDPPYDRFLERDIAGLLAGSKWVHSDTLIIIEESIQTENDWLAACGLELVKDKTYKTNRHVFVKQSYIGKDTNV